MALSNGALKEKECSKENLVAALQAFLPTREGKMLAAALEDRMNAKELASRSPKPERREATLREEKFNDAVAKKDARVIVYTKTALPKLARIMRKWREGVFLKAIVRWKGAALLAGSSVFLQNTFPSNPYVCSWC